MKKTVVITDFVTEPTIEREVLGPDVDIVCLDETNEDKYPDIIHEASALLVWHGHLTSNTFSKMKNCQAIVRYGTGYETIDIDSARTHGIPVCNTRTTGLRRLPTQPAR